jgi:hypothetical protein
MKETEGEEKAPALVHTDLRVVDGELNEISPSFFAAKYKPCLYSSCRTFTIPLLNIKS